MQLYHELTHLVRSVEIVNEVNMIDGVVVVQLVAIQSKAFSRERELEHELSVTAYQSFGSFQGYGMGAPRANSKSNHDVDTIDFQA